MHTRHHLDIHPNRTFRAFITYQHDPGYLVPAAHTGHIDENTMSSYYRNYKLTPRLLTRTPLFRVIGVISVLQKLRTAAHVSGPMHTMVV